MPTAKVNSVEIYYEETGSGPPIILSAGGLQGTLAGYGPVIGELSREHRVISYDRRFGGQSNSPLVVQTWDMVCQDVMDLMDALCIERASWAAGLLAPPYPLGAPCSIRDGSPRYSPPTLPAVSFATPIWP